MPDPTWANAERQYDDEPVEERMPAQCSYAECYFDDWPPRKGKRAHLANKHPYACSFCGAAITALSDYGWLDTTLIDSEDDEPEWLSACWECKRPILYAMEER